MRVPPPAVPCCLDLVVRERLPVRHFEMRKGGRGMPPYRSDWAVPGQLQLVPQPHPVGPECARGACGGPGKRVVRRGHGVDWGCVQSPLQRLSIPFNPRPVMY